MITCTFCNQFESENPFDFAQTRTEVLSFHDPDKPVEENIMIMKDIIIACCKPCFESGKTINV